MIAHLAWAVGRQSFYLLIGREGENEPFGDSRIKEPPKEMVYKGHSLIPC